MLRKNYGASEDPVKLAREEACKVYLAPEIVSAINPSPTGSADVFSYAVILFEIATRVDVYSVCDAYCTYVYVCSTLKCQCINMTFLVTNLFTCRCINT